MKLSIIIFCFALFLLGCGFQSPSLFFIGYLWTSVLYPSAFATTFIPLSMTFGICCVGGYFFIDKRDAGRLPAVFYLAAVFAVWITLTTMTADSAQEPWTKWNWAVQSTIIAVAAPIFLRTRVQIEMALIATLSAFSAHAMTGGVKSIIGTGGYDRLGRLMMSNIWLGETSTLALACVLTLPMAYYCLRHSVIFEQFRGRLMNAIFAGYAVLALMCMVGTSARTGLMSLGTLLLFGIKGIVRKVLIVGLAAGFYFFGQSLLPGKSLDRFDTMGSYQQDTSAIERLAVWQWARDYARQHPFGGGFGIFYTNDIVYTVKGSHGENITAHRQATAPHSVYFEVLGEQGYPGLALYLAMLLSGLWGTYRISRWRLGGPDSQWQAPFARLLFTCITVFAVGGAFVGIAFQPLLYLFLGFYGCVYRLAYAQRVGRQKISPNAQPFGRTPNEVHA